MLADDVQRLLGEYVCAWRRRALVAMSSPDLISVCTHSFVNQQLNEFVSRFRKRAAFHTDEPAPFIIVRFSSFVVVAIFLSIGIALVIPYLPGA